MHTRLDRRSLAAGAAALVGGLPAAPGVAARDRAPAGHVVVAPLDPATGGPVPGLAVRDMATGETTAVAFAGSGGGLVVDDILPVLGSPHVLARAGDASWVVNATTGSAVRITGGPVGVDPAADLFVGRYRLGPVHPDAPRWLTVERRLDDHLLIDLETGELIDLMAVVNTGDAFDIAQVGAGGTLALSDGGRLLFVDPETLEIVRTVDASPGVWFPRITPERDALAYLTRGSGGGWSVAFAPIAVGDVLRLPVEGDAQPTLLAPIATGDALVLLPSATGTDVVRVTADPPSGTPAQTVAGTIRGGVGQPRVVAFGTRALVAADLDVTTWHLLDLEGGGAYALPELDGLDPAAPPTFSTRAALFTGPAREGDGTDFRALNTATGAVAQPLLAGGGDDLAVTALAAPGDRTAAVGLSTSGFARCFVLDLVRSGSVTVDRALPAAWAPDGRHLLTWSIDPASGARGDLSVRGTDGAVVTELGPATLATWVP